MPENTIHGTIGDLDKKTQKEENQKEEFLY